MGKQKISSKHQKYLEKLSKMDLDKVPGLERVEPLKDLTNETKTSEAVFECLLNNDPEGAMEMIAIYLDAVNKSGLKKKSQLPRSTLYSALKHKNPTIKTLAKIMYASTH